MDNIDFKVPENLQFILAMFDDLTGILDKDTLGVVNVIDIKDPKELLKRCRISDIKTIFVN